VDFWWLFGGFLVDFWWIFGEFLVEFGEILASSGAMEANISVPFKQIFLCIFVVVML